MANKKNSHQNNPRYEVFLALYRLADADYRIDRFDNANIGFEYRAARCYTLSCGYSITNIGIFDSKYQKVNISRAYEKKLYELAEKKFNSINNSRRVLTATKTRIKKTSH